MSSSSSNASLAKARAMYGKRLRREDYEQLASCKSISELSSYLSSQTKYKDILSTVYAHSLHREQLECLIDKRLYLEYASLCRYMTMGGAYISRYFQSRREVSVLMKAVVQIFVGESDEYYYILQSDFDRASKIKISELSSARSYDDIIKAAAETPYCRVLGEYRPRDKERIQIARLDLALNNFVFDSFFQSIGHAASGEEARVTAYLFGTYIDAVNFTTVRRLRRYPGADAEYMRSMMIKNGSLSQKQLDLFITAKSDGELLEAAEKTPLAKSIKRFGASDDLAARVMTHLCRHYLRFTPYPAVAVMSYLTLVEAEMSNIVKIIEGIRYSLPEDDILAMLNTEV